MSETEEIAKAIQAVAKFGEKGFDVAEKAGGFFAKVFKEPAEVIAGIITDKFIFIRWKRFLKMVDEVNMILAQRGITEYRAVPPKIALPIIEGASLEDEPELQILWNNLLANAMDPSFNDEIRYGFIDMIKNITGIEARILNELYRLLQKENYIKPIAKITEYSFNKEGIMSALNISEEQYALAITNLIRMQLLSMAILEYKGGKINGVITVTTTMVKGIDVVTLTPLGVKFVEACIM